MCGILAVLGCSDDSQAKRVRVLELSRRQFSFFFLTLHFHTLFGVHVLRPCNFIFFSCIAELFVQSFCFVYGFYI